MGSYLYTAVHEVTAWYVQKRNAAVRDRGKTRSATVQHVGTAQSMSECRNCVAVRSQPPSQCSRNRHVTPPLTPIHVALPLLSLTPNTLPLLLTPPFVVVNTCLLPPSTPLHVTLPLSSSTPNISALTADTFVTYAHMTPPPLLLTPDTSTRHFHLRHHRRHLCDPYAHDTSALTINTSRTLATPPTPPPSLPTPLPSPSTPPWHLAHCCHRYHFT